MALTSSVVDLISRDLKYPFTSIRNSPTGIDDSQYTTLSPTTLQRNAQEAAITKAFDEFYEALKTTLYFRKNEFLEADLNAKHKILMTLYDASDLDDKTKSKDFNERLKRHAIRDNNYSLYINYSTIYNNGSRFGPRESME